MLSRALPFCSCPGRPPPHFGHNFPLLTLLLNSPASSSPSGSLTLRILSSPPNFFTASTISVPLSTLWVPSPTCCSPTLPRSLLSIVSTACLPRNTLQSRTAAHLSQNVWN